MSPLLSRRSLLAGIGGLFVSGCTSRAAVENWVFNAKPNQYPYTRAESDSFPYAQLAAQFGTRPKAALVLASLEGSIEKWASSDEVTVSLQHGRVISTEGLDEDLTRTETLGFDPLSAYQPGQGALGGSSAKLIDFRTETLLHRNARIESQWFSEGTETIEILGRSYDTLRIREDFQSGDLGWQGSNRYWLSQRYALVWRSIQHLAPGVEPLTLEVLKRAA